ncbi:hypothetical protein V6N12_059471 [Hibiscus sabdariffa]|uniref:Uncharacterized protein n=1 Tax=Hibiscus sabdariffa TaxID=183260 RepID=A0ABR2EVP3_9ROSI
MAVRSFSGVDGPVGNFSGKITVSVVWLHHWLLAASLRQLVDETRWCLVTPPSLLVLLLAAPLQILLGFWVGFTNQQPNTTRQSGADTLCKVRGKGCDVESELAELKNANDIAKELTSLHSMHRFYSNQLVLGNNSALIEAIIWELVNLASILVSTGIVDQFGRRFLFMEAGTQMFVCQDLLDLHYVERLDDGFHFTILAGNQRRQLTI